MRIARGLWGGWTWLLLCQCSAAPAPQDPAARSGGATRTSDAAVAAQSSSARARDAGDAEPNGDPDADRGSAPAHDGGADRAPSNGGPASGGSSASNNTPQANTADSGAADASHSPRSTSGAGHTSAADSGTPNEDSSCLAASGAPDQQGTFAFETKTAQTLKLWLPKLPAGCKAPVVHFSNGTGATCANYQPVLERLASHGFLSVCTENTNTGSGALGVQALEAVLEMYPDLAAHKLGSAGHEAGGQGAILTLQQAETKWGSAAIYAGMGIAPASGFGTQPPSGTWQDAYANLRSPMLMMSGTNDTLVSESRLGEAYALFDDNIEAYWYSGIDALHIPIPYDYINELAIAWFRWKLLDDADACQYFKQLPDGERWDNRAEQNAKACR